MEFLFFHVHNMVFLYAAKRWVQASGQLMSLTFCELPGSSEAWTVINQAEQDSKPHLWY